MRRLVTISIDSPMTVEETHRVAEAISHARRTGTPLVLGGGAVVRTHELGTQPPKAHVDRCALAVRAPRLRQQGKDRRSQRQELARSKDARRREHLAPHAHERAGAAAAGVPRSNV